MQISKQTYNRIAEFLDNAKRLPGESFRECITRVCKEKDADIDVLIDFIVKYKRGQVSIVQPKENIFKIGKTNVSIGQQEIDSLSNF